MISVGVRVSFGAVNILSLEIGRVRGGAACRRAPGPLREAFLLNSAFFFLTDSPAAGSYARDRGHRSTRAGISLYLLFVNDKCCSLCAYYLCAFNSHGPGLLFVGFCQHGQELLLYYSYYYYCYYYYIIIIIIPIITIIITIIIIILLLLFLLLLLLLVLLLLSLLLLLLYYYYY